MEAPSPVLSSPPFSGWEREDRTRRAFFTSLVNLTMTGYSNPLSPPVTTRGLQRHPSGLRPGAQTRGALACAPSVPSPVTSPLALSSLHPHLARPPRATSWKEKQEDCFGKSMQLGGGEEGCAVVSVGAPRGRMVQSFPGRSEEGALRQAAAWAPVGRPQSKWKALQAKYQHVKKEVALRGHLCVTAGDVGKRRDHKSLEGDPRFPIWGGPRRCSFHSFFRF